jgi:hypothetical protein
MAHINNWMPTMTADERAWFDRCPKAVLFVIARELAMLRTGGEDRSAAFSLMKDEWGAQHQSGHVPQKPFNPSKPRRKAVALDEIDVALLCKVFDIGPYVARAEDKDRARLDRLVREGYLTAQPVNVDDALYVLTERGAAARRSP